jgi:hypothetical protein
MKLKFFSFAVLGLMVILFGCYPAGPEYVEELDIAYTNHDKDYNFVSVGTYSMPDKVVKITGKENAPPEYVKDIYAFPILAQIDANMQKLGWSKVAANSTEDIQLLPAAWESTTILYGGYWGGYYCWYYPYYCGGYGWYYPYSAVYTYTTGTLVMTMTDLTQPSTDGNRRVVWTGAINGLLSGAYDAGRVNKGIDQTFTQSPYLKTN